MSLLNFKGDHSLHFTERGDPQYGISGKDFFEEEGAQQTGSEFS